MDYKEFNLNDLVDEVNSNENKSLFFSEVFYMDLKKGKFPKFKLVENKFESLWMPKYQKKPSLENKLIYDVYAKKMSSYDYFNITNFLPKGIYGNYDPKFNWKTLVKEINFFESVIRNDLSEFSPSRYFVNDEDFFDELNHSERFFMKLKKKADEMYVPPLLAALTFMSEDTLDDWYAKFDTLSGYFYEKTGLDSDFFYSKVEEANMEAIVENTISFKMLKTFTGMYMSQLEQYEDILNKENISNKDEKLSVLKALNRVNTYFYFQSNYILTELSTCYDLIVNHDYKKMGLKEHDVDKLYSGVMKALTQEN